MAIQLALGRTRLELLELVGQGATSLVYRVRRLPDGQIAALKLARDAAALPLLAAEGERLAFSGGMGLPALLAAGRLRGAPADLVAGGGGLLLEWVAGEPLVGPLSLETWLGVALELAEALSELHSSGACHGDIKPANALFDGTRVRLVDLGLGGPSSLVQPRGGTPRYFAPEVTEPELRGDGRTRDLYALGLMLAELAEPALVTRELSPTSGELLSGAQRELVLALTRRSPGLRVSAQWVVDRIGTLLGKRPTHPTSERRSRASIERAYLCLRRTELLASAQQRQIDWQVSGLAREWLERALGLLRGLAELRGRALDEQPTSLTGTSASQRRRFVVSLVGPSAARWPVSTEASESAWLERHLSAALRCEPRQWTAASLLSDETGQSAAEPLDALELASRLGEGSFGERELQQSEHLVFAGQASTAFSLRLARCLRARSALARAWSILETLPGPDAAAERAELARRLGDRARMELEAAGVDSDASPTARSRVSATLARAAVDRREFALARELVSAAPEHAALREVQALLALSEGHYAELELQVEQGLALAQDEETRARLVALRGMAAHAQGRPQASREAFEQAVLSAVKAGAVLEEASYQTGLAAAAVDLGAIELALAAAERSQALFEWLERPALAARAVLNRVAAWAALGQTDELRRAADEALSLAFAARDRRCEGYIHLALAEHTPEPSSAAEHAQAALRCLADSGSEDELRAWARAHQCGILPVELARGDQLAQAASPLVRLEWWTARARVALVRGNDAETSLIVGMLASLVDSPAPLTLRGQAFALGARMAERAGLGDSARRLYLSAAEAAATLFLQAGERFAPAVASLVWVEESRAGNPTSFSPHQVRDIESLVRALNRRDRLRPLLEQVLDSLVLWTGVERGLLLLRAPGDRLVVRAARNLARHDLVGEQLSLSQGLAKRALELGDAIVAVDASGELESVHASVHALKLRSVLAVPLVAHGSSLGVVYLDDRVRCGAFGPRELAWVRLVAAVAAMAIADARDRLLLRRAERRALRAERRAGERLALREEELETARVALAASRLGRPTGAPFARIVGESSQLHQLLRMVERVAPSDLSVLIHGESGTGKELIARALHDASSRCDGPFVAENCGSLPESLLESVLFGHVRGAFTGAVQSRSGLFELAQGGTLFLDEIGEMSPGLQSKLLRVLEDGSFRPIGSDRSKQANVRLIAATHRDLRAMAAAGQFRSDLLYRLDVIALELAPLRERAEDIPRLVRHLIDKHAKGRGVTVSREAMAALGRHAWPGNIRQLENELRRALVLADEVILVEHLSDSLRAQPIGLMADPESLNMRERLDALAASLVMRALETSAGNQTRAAELLGLSRFGLQKMVKRLGLVAAPLTGRAADSELSGER